MLLLGVLPTTGCSAVAGRHSSWVASHGGLLHDATDARLCAIGGAFASKAVDQPVRFHVLNSATLEAFSFHDGDIFLSRGLIAAATDEEIIAAVAHELGHLIADGHAKGKVTPVALKGPSDVEARADAVGCSLLKAEGQSSRAMETLLEKVAAASEGGMKREIQRRIGLLSLSR